MAQRNKFRFETLLRLRRMREDGRQRIVAARLSEIRRLEERKTTLLGRIHRQTDLTRRELRTDRLELNELRSGRHWMIRLRRGVLETKAEIATNRALLAQERSNLAEAAKERNILSLLKERQHARFVAEENRRDQAESDEMSILRYVHRVGGKENDCA